MKNINKVRKFLRKNNSRIQDWEVYQYLKLNNENALFEIDGVAVGFISLLYDTIFFNNTHTYISYLLVSDDLKGTIFEDEILKWAIKHTKKIKKKSIAVHININDSEERNIYNNNNFKIVKNDVRDCVGLISTHLIKLTV